MFDKSQRGTFKYTIAHVLAFNATALSLGVWKPRHIFHDWEKPWMLLIAKALRKPDPYAWVQHWHRTHRKHHVEYWDRYWKKTVKLDGFIDMVIDWECSRVTKQASPLTARQKFDKMNQAHELNRYVEAKLFDAFDVVKL